MRSMLVLVSLAIAALASPAAACEKISVLVYAIDSGRAEARLNGVPVVSSGSEDTITGMLQIGHWYLAGDNVLEVKSIGADAKVRIELTDSCQGQMVDTRGGNDGTVQLVELEGERSVRKIIKREAGADTPYANAPAEGDAGLADAVARLRKAVAEKDVDVIVEMHGPMLKMAERMGMQGADGMLRGMLGELLPAGKAIFEEPLMLEPAMNGRVHVATAGPDRKPPVILRQEQDDGSFQFTTGQYWARVDGRWLIVAN